MCEGIDSEGANFILEFNSIKGVVEAGVQKVSIVSEQADGLKLLECNA